MFKLIILLLCLTLVNSLNIEYPDDGEEIKNLINDCGQDGRNQASKGYCDKVTNKTFEYLQDYEEYFGVCESAFKLACLEEREEIQCGAGTSAAQENDDCENSTSESFKKCCNACKFGLNMKKNGGGLCPDFVNSLGQVSKIVVEKCFEGSFDFCYKKEVPVGINEIEFETNAIDSSIAGNLVSVPVRRCKHFNPCGAFEDCIDHDGKIACICKTGYSNKGGLCEDIDECENGFDNCSHLNRQCMNLNGSFKCGECVEGYKTKHSYYVDNADEVCVRSDPCETNVCGENEICTNVNDLHRCSKFDCPTGYKHENSTECIGKSCSSSKYCHKTISFLFKIVSPTEFNSEIFRFTTTTYKAKFNGDFFEINKINGQQILSLKKPLVHDENIRILISDGRKNHIKYIKVFKSLN